MCRIEKERGGEYLDACCTAASQASFKKSSHTCNTHTDTHTHDEHTHTHTHREKV